MMNETRVSISLLRNNCESLTVTTMCHDILLQQFLNCLETDDIKRHYKNPLNKTKKTKKLILHIHCDNFSPKQDIFIKISNDEMHLLLYIEHILCHAFKEESENKENERDYYDNYDIEKMYAHLPVMNEMITTIHESLNNFYAIVEKLKNSEKLIAKQNNYIEKKQLLLKEHNI